MEKPAQLTESTQPTQNTTEAHELPGAVPPAIDVQREAEASRSTPTTSTTTAPNTNPTPDVTPAPDASDLANPPPPYQAKELPVAPNEADATIVAVPLGALHSEPAIVDCPKCKKRGLTRTDTSPNGSTHCAALVLCCLVSCLLAWLPYVIKSCNDIEHRCAHCGAVLALYKSSGGIHVVPHSTPPLQTSTPAPVQTPVAAPPPAVTK